MPAWTGVQLPPPPKRLNSVKWIRSFFILPNKKVDPRGMSAEKVFLRSIGIGGDRLTTSKKYVNKITPLYFEPAGNQKD